jgi:hypothetical protein
MVRTTVLLALLLSPAAIRADPPPLTEDQKARISRLANETKQEADRLKSLLDQRQVELANLYAQYKLDEDKASKVENEILDLQRQMLADYRKMHLELRTLVGEERFNLLRRRLDNMLKTPPKEAKEKGR